MLSPFAFRPSFSLLNLTASMLLSLCALVGCNMNELGNLGSKKLGDLSNPAAPRASFDEDLVDACGQDGPARPLDSAFLRAPYLQKTQATSTEVLWVSSSTDAETLRAFAPDTGDRLEANSSVDTSAELPAGRQRVAAIGGLEPATVYCYELFRDGESVFGPVGFRTAPLPSSDEPVRFATMGDLGKRSSDQLAVLDQLATVQFDFVLINGDVAYEDGHLREFEENFFSVYAQMLWSVPFFVASGNHDYRTGDAAPYRQVFSLFENGGPEGRERWFSYDWGNVHVIVLDTERVGPVQAAWLEADLEKNRLPWVIVTGHRPAFSSGHHGNDAAVQRHFVPLFEKYRVPLVIAGHDHNYERTVTRNGVTYIVTGAGGRGTRDVGSSSFTAFSEAVAHFVYVEIQGDTLVLHAIDAAGAEFDSLMITLD